VNAKDISLRTTVSGNNNAVNEADHPWNLISRKLRVGRNHCVTRVPGPASQTARVLDVCQL
jgi:hypothetical protein